jgi:uncharacterized protein (DUF362 family)/Pyruvate/2-oxoacid:ferredoxin oxidoreductase delta subunit
MSTVAIMPCADYRRDNVRAAVGKCLDACDGLEALLADKRVLLKPNLLSSTARPEHAVNTHPEVVRAVAEILISDFRCKVLIGDSCGTVAPGATARALENSGIASLASELGIESVNFDTCGAERVTSPGATIMREFYVARPALEADVIFNLPKFKTHHLVLLTGAIKNMLGAIPGRGKKLVHLAAPKPDAMAAALTDIYEIIRPRITLTDAVTGMEGTGPNGGKLRHVGLLLASTDGVALDAVAGDIMSYRPGDVLTTQFAHQRRIGTGALDAISVLGEPLERARIADFKKPVSYGKSWLFRLIPDRAARWAMQQFSACTSVIAHARCVRCKECIVNCPVGRLKLEHGRVAATSIPCIACYCCEEVCDYDAIHIVRSPMLQAAVIARDLMPWRRRRSRKARPACPRRQASTLSKRNA